MSGTGHVFARLHSPLMRMVGFYALWMILSELAPLDLLVGAPVAAIATWTSLRLLPPGQSSFRPVALTLLMLRFLKQSIGAGIDVARRALDPRLPLRPGFVTYSVRFPPGMTRNAFTALTSLLPGTVPAGEENGQLVYHCLDVGQPVVTELAAEEKALTRAIRHD